MRKIKLTEFDVKQLKDGFTVSILVDGELREVQLVNMEKEQREKMMSECWSCQHRRAVVGNAHIQCVKPDGLMTGDKHGIKEGWFMYPLLFDPTWKMKLCSNYEGAVKQTVSRSVSDAS